MKPDLYKIGLAVIRDNRLLLCRPFAFEDLIVPGGIKEGEESAIENLRREVHEELGPLAALDEESIKYLDNYTDRAAGRTDRTVEIELYIGSIEGPLEASTEIRDLVWVDPANSTAEKLSDIVKNKILPDLVRRGLLHQ